MRKLSNKKQSLIKQIIPGIVSAGLLVTAGATTAADFAEHNDPRFTDAGLPTRGIHMSRVSKKWGQPQSKKSAVGKPPISSWRYDGFNVYFEHSLVITSVSDGDVSSAYTR